MIYLRGACIIFFSCSFRRSGGTAIDRRRRAFPFRIKMRARSRETRGRVQKNVYYLCALRLFVRRLAVYQTVGRSKKIFCSQLAARRLVLATSIIIVEDKKVAASDAVAQCTEKNEQQKCRRNQWRPELQCFMIPRCNSYSNKCRHAAEAYT